MTVACGRGIVVQGRKERIIPLTVDIAFHRIPLHPLHSVAFHSIPFHSIPSHCITYHLRVCCAIVVQMRQVAPGVAQQFQGKAGVRI